MDRLTGLPDRRAFFDRLSDGRPAVVALLDLDGFRQVNDNYGHVVGDHLLREVGRRLAEHCPSEAFVSRLGDDEFGVIGNDRAMLGDPRHFCEMIGTALRPAFEIGKHRIRISASIGCVVSNGRGAGNDAILERADYALDYAKNSLRGETVVFGKNQVRDIEDLFKIDQALRQCDPEEEFRIVFQPQFDMQAGRTVGFEALARWHSPLVGEVRPDKFIKVAERAGLISMFTPILLRKTLEGMAQWSGDLRVSFNLAAHDILSPGTINAVLSIVDRSGIDPRRIEFEVTETAMMSDFERARANLRILSQRGHAISLDDFGAGYSNFRYLKRLPIQKLKIDRSFLQNITKDERAFRLVKSMIEMAQGLQLECILEGVETIPEMLALRKANARYIQGYIISRPIVANAVRLYLLKEANGFLERSGALTGKADAIP